MSRHVYKAKDFKIGKFAYDFEHVPDIKTDKVISITPGIYLNKKVIHVNGAVTFLKFVLSFDLAVGPGYKE